MTKDDFNMLKALFHQFREAPEAQLAKAKADLKARDEEYELMAEDFRATCAERDKLRAQVRELEEELEEICQRGAHKRLWNETDGN